VSLARYSIPPRCDRPATALYANGYRACPTHVEPVEPGDRWPQMHDGPFGPCDYPMDGLGAARYVKAPRA
jgi:hypothetical protein